MSRDEGGAPEPRRRSIRKEEPLDVVIVDDHALVRQEMRSLLENYPDIHVVGEASDGFEAINLVERLRPSIVLMDINMPRMNGIEATAEITRAYPDTIVIGLSVNADTNNQTMKRAGAVRLIRKEEAPDLLYQAMHEAVMNQEITAHC